MSQVRRPSGLELDLPDSYRVIDPPSSLRAAVLPGAAVDPHDALVNALDTQELEVVDQPTLQPVHGAADHTIRLRLPVAAHEDGALLLEQDGLYSWHFPTVQPSPPTGSLAAGVAAPGQILVFEVPVTAAPEPATAARRGLIAFPHPSFGPIRTVVLKFAVHLAVGKVIAFLERKVDTGLVTIAGTDVATWGLVGDPATVALPADRPARVLLLVHGTFSSTVGSFGPLAASGEDVLRRAFARYDAVLGFDHRTLSVDPLENATELVGLLRRLPTALPPVIDAVSYSRGALVLRSLFEEVLPRQPWQPRVEHAVFVAGTNHGTKLAQATHWADLLDLYTNLVMAAARMLGPATPVALVVAGMVRGLGALVQVLAPGFDDAVPGLGAMDPEGEFITALEAVQAGQPTPATSNYYAIRSRFDVKSILADPRLSELPQRLLEMIEHGVVAQVMGGSANDLVVDMSSMTSLEGSDAMFDDTYDFSDERGVHHTTYFQQAETATAIAGWLGI